MIIAAAAAAAVVVVVVVVVVVAVVVMQFLSAINPMSMTWSYVLQVHKRPNFGQSLSPTDRFLDVI